MQRQRPASLALAELMASAHTDEPHESPLALIFEYPDLMPKLLEALTGREYLAFIMCKRLIYQTWSQDAAHIRRLYDELCDHEMMEDDLFVEPPDDRTECEQEVELMRDRRDASPFLTWALSLGNGLLERNVSYILRAAIEGGNEEITRLCLQTGLDIDNPDDLEKTPLMRASDAGELKIVRLLIEWRAELEVTDEDEWTALFFAVYSGQTECVHLLIGAGANVHAIGDRYETALHWAAYSNDDAEIVSTLLKAGADVNAVDDEKQTALHWAICPQTIHALLDRGAWLEHVAEKSGTALMCAVHNGREDVVRTLLARGATARDA